MDILKKIKPVYIYIFALLSIIIGIIIIGPGNSEPQISANIAGKNMPEDDIHKNMNPMGNEPSRSNVSQSFKHQLEMLKKAYEGNPEDTVKAKAYAEVLASAHMTEQAIPILEKILLKGPKRTDILLGLTLMHYNASRIDKAEEYTNIILSFDKDNREANYNLGAIAATRGDKSKAKLIWEKIIDRYPESEAAKLAAESLKRL